MYTGEYTILIKAMGRHGCRREVPSGGVVIEGCGRMDCPDCQARHFINILRTTGALIIMGEMTHWPGSQHAVTDNLKTGVRRGNFP